MRQQPNHRRAAGPSVLVVAAAADGRRLAALLGEAGIAAVRAGGRRAPCAAAQGRYDLAVVAAPAVAALRRRRPDLDILCIDEAALAAPRRLIGRVRERLGAGEALQRRAECVIAEAKLACLYRRRDGALADGAEETARELAREIDETLALRDRLRCRPDPSIAFAGNPELRRGS